MNQKNLNTPNQNDSKSKKNLQASSWGMHTKLIVLFIVIKVLPLVFIALLAWSETAKMGNELDTRITKLRETLDEVLFRTGEIATNDSMKAIEERAKREIERTGTDLANSVASLLYSVDGDIKFLSTLEPSKNIYANFINSKTSKVIQNDEYILAEDGNSWILAEKKEHPEYFETTNKENYEFTYRPPDNFTYVDLPLYVEASFISLEGKELIKVVNNDRMDPRLKDVSIKSNTFAGSESYFPELAKLKSGEIYVSSVIGEYVGSKILGPYTPANAEKKGIPFEPEKAAYASDENPNGIKFEGIIRWAMPVEKNGRRIGYVTLAFNHDHILSMFQTIMPTDDRYSALPDNIRGNYAFMWDSKGRNIVHPRHHSIVGYNPKTGEQEVPWLEQSIYDKWQASSESYTDFIADYPIFHEQTTKKRPAKELTAQGLLGLDCRYLNNAPQCTGWTEGARHGGSGSFIILWTGLRKLSTSAAVPYYTGQYGESKIGFAMVTMSAGLEDFHAPALQTKQVLDALITHADQETAIITEDAENFIADSTIGIAKSLTWSTIVMSVIVVIIAIMIASALTRMIKKLLNGFMRFRYGERQFRFNTDRKDELGTLADSFDNLANTLAESIDEPQVILDGDKKIIYLNDAAEKWYDKNLSAVLGKSFFDIAYYEEMSAYCPMGAYCEGKTAEIMYNAEKDIFFQDKAVRINTSDDVDAELGYIITSTDMTALIKNERFIEEQRMLLDTVFISSPDLMWLKDVATNKYLMVNPRFASLFGKDREELIGVPSSDVLDETVKIESLSSEQIVLQEASTHLSEQTLKFHDGHTEILEMSRTPIYNASNDLVSILGMGRDVTQRVQTQNRLLEIQHKLEEALREANAANSAKSDFLARMSHEIRTPMNAIIGMTDILQRSLLDPSFDHDKTSRHLEYIAKSSKHLLSLLNDILDLSKIEAGKIELEISPIDLNAVVAAVDVIIRPRCEEKDINFIISVDSAVHPYVLSDALRLRQVLINLLGNAVKFTSPKGDVQLNIRLHEKHETHMIIGFEILDNGIGIPEESLDKLFKPFEQAEAKTSRLYGGTGLGLSISSSIISLLGGEITVTSTVDKGSSFNFSLTLHIDKAWDSFDENLYMGDDKAIDLSSENTAEAKPSSRRILLADDVELNRIIIVEMLSGHNFEIDEVVDGTEALAKFAESDPGYYDIILMDVLMPQMSGYEAATEIRKLDKADAQSIPIVAVTANAFKDDVAKAIESGMNAHLAKPIEYDKLIAVIMEYLVGTEK